MHHPKRSLGQNFLIDHNIVRKILYLAEVTSYDTILEIGPGHGMLTSALLATGSSVVAIEKDHELAQELTDRFIDTEEVTILGDDALLVNYPNIIERPYKVVANLPYNIATALLAKIMQSGHTPELLVVMVQKEVAEKIYVCPPHASIMSNVIQAWGAVSLAHIVSPDCFRPRPNVDSALLVIEPFSKQLLEPSYVARYIKLIHSGFSQKRKKLISNLASSYALSKKELESTFTKLGLAVTVRAEEVTVSQWISLLSIFV
jgi:16S rRNA (adenine1518-N6/adenine1519-N6)-dimethyltransferase